MEIVGTENVRKPQPAPGKQQRPETFSRKWILFAAAVLGLLVTMTSAAFAGGLTETSRSAAATAGSPTVLGHLDTVVGGHLVIHTAGWSFDPRLTRGFNTENVVVDGVMAALPLADLPRADVNRVMHVTGRHGFAVTVRATSGPHRVCVISRPVANSGTHWTILGCRSVFVH